MRNDYRLEKASQCWNTEPQDTVNSGSSIEESSMNRQCNDLPQLDWKTPSRTDAFGGRGKQGPRGVWGEVPCNPVEDMLEVRLEIMVKASFGCVTKKDMQTHLPPSEMTPIKKWLQMVRNVLNRTKTWIHFFSDFFFLSYHRKLGWFFRKMTLKWP